MKLSRILISALFTSTVAVGYGSTGLPIIPQPASVELSGDSTKVALTDNYTLTANRSMPKAEAALKRAFGDPKHKGKIKVILNLRPDKNGTASEGYTLNISPKTITISASDEAGIFYGVQTLAALASTSSSGSLPLGIIEDAPRFPYRGMMLDISRNFRDREFIEKQIDAMAQLKLNNLHLHLTDAAGWRLETESAPRLNTLASWRVGETWKDWCASDNRYLPNEGECVYGGYLTKDDIREIVNYAADRFITVIPEIEMPSHSEEVLAAYPFLSCSGEAIKGESDFCIGNDSIFTFMERILDETMEIFPSKLIHIGGDEAPKTAWKTCPKCQKRIADLNLEGVDQLQSYFIGRIEEYLNSKGRDMLGWDEIMEGGLAPNATVMSWRGTEGGEKAAATGHRVIMTPGGYCYFDAYQDAPPSQPEAIGGYLPLEKAYSFEPVPESLKDTENEHYIYGLQGNLFTEYVPTASHAEYMLYPRMYAVAERAWSPASISDFPDFRNRAVGLSKKMSQEGYNVFDLENEIGNRPGSEKPIDHKARGKKVSYGRKPWPKYPANGDATLTDGLLGGWTYGDARWQAFLGTRPDCMEATIDLETITDITSVSADFMQSCGADVWLPAQVVIEASTDGETFETLATIDNKVERTTTITFRTFDWKGTTKARYIRMKAQVDEKIGGVLFIDEIVVN